MLRVVGLGRVELAVLPRDVDGIPVIESPEGDSDALADDVLPTIATAAVAGVAVDGPAENFAYALVVKLLPNALTDATFGDWDRAASETAAILRSAAGRDPYNRELSDLVGALATQSEAFRTRWAAHNVRFHNTGVKHFHHPVVGDLNLTYNRLDLAADPGLTLFTYTAEPGSRSEEALKLLGSWAATVDPARAADPS